MKVDLANNWKHFTMDLKNHEVAVYCLVVVFLSHSRIFLSDGDVIIVSEKLQILTYARQQWGFSSVPQLLWHGTSVYNGETLSKCSMWKVCDLKADLNPRWTHFSEFKEHMNMRMTNVCHVSTFETSTHRSKRNALHLEQFARIMENQTTLREHVNQQKVYTATFYSEDIIIRWDCFVSTACAWSSIHPVNPSWQRINCQHPAKSLNNNTKLRYDLAGNNYYNRKSNVFVLGFFVPLENFSLICRSHIYR